MAMLNNQRVHVPSGIFNGWNHEHLNFLARCEGSGPDRAAHGQATASQARPEATAPEWWFNNNISGWLMVINDG
jgi:hypothetical protein